jgi:hypothetical protein
LKLEALAARFVAIKAAAAIIYMSDRDSHSMFADTLRGPDRNSVQIQYFKPHGPAEPVARLLWLAHDPTAQPFLPTNAERDAALNAFTSQRATGAHAAAINNM